MRDAYGDGGEMPLGGYVAILAAFGTAAAGVLAAAAISGKKLPRRLSGRDIALFGIATHKLTRIVTRDWITSPIRAPFTEFNESTGSGEVSETSRGSGLQRAIGDLLTCPFCTGPWIAGALYSTYLFNRSAARFVDAMFASVTVSDWLHNGYEAVRKVPKQLGE
ncbi:MAG: DUF1360 domain-containing protein [Thermoanaerobaculia bacterium]